MFVLTLYRNQDCIDLIHSELEYNPEFLVLNQHESESYFTKIDTYSTFSKYFENDVLAGFISYYCNNLETKEAFITLVLVNRLYRGRSIARKLIENVLITLKKNGFFECKLEVRKDNINAIKLYESLGFSTLYVSADKLVMSVLV